MGKDTFEQLRAIKLGKYTRKNLPHMPSVTIERTVDGVKYDVFLHLNYVCAGAYGQEQEVELNGVIVDVWDKSNAGHTAHGATGDLEYLEDTIRATCLRAAEQCPHSRKQELSQQECKDLKLTHWGMCWHVYRCLDCGDTWGVDSSG